MRTTISVLCSLFLLLAGLGPAEAKEVVYSLPARPEKKVVTRPLAVIPLPGGSPRRIQPGRAGEVLVFQVLPPPKKRQGGDDRGQAPAGQEENQFGAAILDLKKAALSILPGTNPSNPRDLIRGQLDVTANAHSVYVSDVGEGSVKRFRISDQELLVERTFEYEDHIRSLGILTASAATTRPLILLHPTKTKFLSADRLLEVTPRYGSQATGSSPPLNNSSDMITDPTGSFFYRGNFLWQWDRGRLISRGKGISIFSQNGGRLSYNGALVPTKEALSAVTAKNTPAAPVPFIAAITRPLSYRLEQVQHRKYSGKLSVCRNQGTTPVLDLQLPDRVYRHHFISFRANRLVAISESPPEILVYELNLEETLESLEAAPWVEVTGPGYLNAGGIATFQMRPAFGKFSSLKLLSPLDRSRIEGTQIIFSSRRDTMTGPQRISLEFTDKQGRKGVTILDLNILGDGDGR